METKLKILNITKTKHAMKYSSLTNEMTEATEQSNRCPIKTKPCTNNGVKVGGAPVSDTNNNNKLYYSHHRNSMITERDPNYTSPETPFNSYYKHSTQNFQPPLNATFHSHSNHNLLKIKTVLANFLLLVHWTKSIRLL